MSTPLDGGLLAIAASLFPETLLGNACKGSSEQHMKPLLAFHLKRNTSKGVNRSSVQQGAQRTGYKRFCLGCIEHNRASVKGKQHDMARSTDIRGKLGYLMVCILVCAFQKGPV